jgi:hypothetical protein
MASDTKNPDRMTKEELVKEGARLGLSSTAALKARYLEDLRREVKTALKAE